MNKEFIKDFCKDKINLFDSDIAKLLVKQKGFEKYSDPIKLDSLRRGISTIRSYYKLRTTKLSRKEINKEIQDLIKKYPEQNQTQLANKLCDRTKLNFKTCRLYINQFINYGNL